MANLKMMELLCSAGHLISGLAFDPDKNSEKEARDILANALNSMRFNPWCAVCGSTKLVLKTRDAETEKMSDLIPGYLDKMKKDSAAKNFYNKLRRAAKNN